MKNYKPVTYAGSATTTPAEVQLSSAGFGIYLTAASASVLISFDGTNYLTLGTNSPPLDGIMFHRFWIKSSAGTIAWVAVVKQ